MTKACIMYSSTNDISTSEAARKYTRSGLNVVPLRTDGSKRPKIKWKRYTDISYPWYQSQSWFSSPANPSGIGIICGQTSGNLEVIDFDDLVCFMPWVRAVGECRSILQTLPIVATPDNGRHIFYRCETIEGNLVLAKDEDEDVLIETRGQGGLVVGVGSPLCTHPTGKPYRLLWGDLMNIPTIQPDAREKLLNTARTFNRYIEPQPKQKQQPVKTKPIAPQVRSMLDELYGHIPCGEGDRPGDKFNEAADWEEILEPHGWVILSVRGHTTYWRKPDSHGDEHHATTNHDKTDRLFVFSSSVQGFHPSRYYSKFAAYATLEHSGCFKAAAASIAERYSF
jgi:putative DNA primase/helicase